MMIRINLLPVRQAQKREMGKQILILGAVVLVGALVGNYLWIDDRESELKQREAKVADTQRRIGELERQIGEVNNINKRKKEVQEKLAVLEKLRKQRAGPVRMLDALASCVPKKVWVRDFNEVNGAVKISGSAESHEDVSEFMRGLQNIVWTPKGMGRIVERKRDATTARIELYSGDDNAMEDFQLTDISSFFTAIELKNSSLSPSDRLVTFEFGLIANYAI